MADGESARTKRVVRQAQIDNRAHPVDADDFVQLFKRDLSDQHTHVYQLDATEFKINFDINHGWRDGVKWVHGFTYLGPGTIICSKKSLNSEFVRMQFLHPVPVVEVDN